MNPDMSSAPERYDSAIGFVMARARYALLRGVLRRAAHWKPLKNPGAGYTIIVGVPWQLWDLVEIPLLSLRRARRDRCAEVILAVDATESSLRELHGHLKIASTIKSFSALKPRMVYYTNRQEKMARRIHWNWVDCWLTWVNGLAATTTRYALLHDFDAVVLDPEFCEKHFDIAQSSNATFVGIQRDFRHYGQVNADLLMTAEMMIDAAAMRSLFKPIDLFNCVRRLNGQRVQCDILRDAQLRLPDSARVLHTVQQDQIVHPSQVISQWHSLQSAEQPFAPAGYSPLFIIPYFQHIRGDSWAMSQVTDALARHERVVALEGKRLDVSGLDQPGRDWIADQIERLDHYFKGQVTAEVHRYCQAIRASGDASSESDPVDIQIRPISAARPLQR